ncbi:MAG: mechanosensitive ion channel [Bacilli bacterium]|nr:mechanosensitive ion channel [Bacillales bacterium]MDY2575647.1 mechanosensitive ion channel [Bacilli bacterium]
MNLNLSFILLEETQDTSLQTIIANVINWLAQHGIKLLIGAIGLIALFIIINLVCKAIKKRVLKKKKQDVHVVNTVFKIINYSLKAIVILVFLGYVGIDTAGVGAVISSLSIVFGLAVQGSLSNLAGGVVIFIMRPFKPGDFIEAQGYLGTVEEIHVFYTYINSPDNKVIMIPNGTLANGNIVNYSKNETRRVDLTFSVSYGSDVDKAKKLIEKIVIKHPLVLKEPSYRIEMSAMADSSIDIICRVWVKNPSYWDAYYDIMDQVKKAFDKEKIEIPFNQLDVHIVK